MPIYAVTGYEPITVERLMAYAFGRGPLDEIREWAEAYAELGPIANVRPAIAWAQACHETGFFTFRNIAKPEWNNPAGLGVTGPVDVGLRFATKRLGCAAHLGHLLVYFGLHHPVPYFCEADTRHPSTLFNDGHKRLPNDIRELGGNREDGKGIRWAPNPLYGFDRGREAGNV